MNATVHTGLPVMELMHWFQLENGTSKQLLATAQVVSIDFEEQKGCVRYIDSIPLYDPKTKDLVEWSKWTQFNEPGSMEVQIGFTDSEFHTICVSASRITAGH